MEPWLDLQKLLIASRSDLYPGTEEAEVLEELLRLRLPALTGSARPAMSSSCT
jgi:hypothetical protein